MEPNTSSHQSANAAATPEAIAADYELKFRVWADLAGLSLQEASRYVVPPPHLAASFATPEAEPEAEPE